MENTEKQPGQTPEASGQENTESIEPEQLVTQAVEEVVSNQELQEAVDPEAVKVQKPKNWIERKYSEAAEYIQRTYDETKEDLQSKESWKKKGKFALDVGILGVVTWVKIKFAFLALAREFINKKGKPSPGAAFEAGQSLFGFDSKKEKK
jgi:phenylalanyl-tRNA synthetase alpha subunit